MTTIKKPALSAPLVVAAPTAAKRDVPVKQKATTSTAAKLPVRKVAVKKAAVEKAAPQKVVAQVPLSKAFASAKPEKIQKPKKPKLVRDSFTIPKADYLVLDELKQRAATLTRPAKKSELLRAGIKILATLSDASFLNALERVPTIKTGRPTLNK